MFNVLFLCTGNSARSIMAEAILNHLGDGRFNSYSAGSHPKGEVHPDTIRLLKQMNLDISRLRSKSLEEFSTSDAPKMDFVFTVCDKAAEMCPIWPGHPVTAHWGVPDPARVEGDEGTRLAAFREAYRQLHHRIRAFTELSWNSLNEAAMKKELESIGRAVLPAEDGRSDLHERSM